MKRILLVKTSSLGDVIHNLPVVNDILQHYPGALIDWVAEESFADIPKLHPAVNQVITVAVRRWRKQILRKKTWHEIATFRRHVSTHSYDLIIDTQGLIKSALITTFASGLTCGQDKKSAREPIASHFYSQKYNIARNQHAVIRNRETTAYACGYTLPTDAPNYGLKATSNAKIDLAKPYIVGLHGTSKESKLWPIEQWVNLVKTLKAQQLNLVLPWASNAEQTRANSIAAKHSNVVVLPKLNITQLANIINNAYAAIGVDTGLSHLATALSVPTIAIYTDTNPALTGVYPGAHAPAVSLGGKAQCPSAAEVASALRQLKP